MGRDQVFAAVCGVKNSGKTTLLEGLVRELSGRGLKVAVIKHDGHDFRCDTPGTDSWRFVEAGACGASVFSGRQVFVRKVGSYPGTGEGTAEQMQEAAEFLRSLLCAFPEADVILLEGGKALPLRKIEIVRSGVSTAPASNPAGRFLIVSDLPAETFGERTLSMEETGKIADAVLEGANCGLEVEAFGQKEECRRKEKACGRKEDAMEDFTHFDARGRARMVNVGEKEATRRTAVAKGRVLVNARTFSLIRSGGMKKGDVLGTAQIAGIMGAKRTADLIPMCHPLFLSGIRLDLELNEEACAVDIRAEVSCEGKTGVEMEALTAVSTAALTVYDMCKAVQRDMEIMQIRLVQKTGGVHGDYHRE